MGFGGGLCFSGVAIRLSRTPEHARQSLGRARAGRAPMRADAWGWPGRREELSAGCRNSNSAACRNSRLFATDS